MPSLRPAANHLLSRLGSRAYAIGIYAGDTPSTLRDAPGAVNPVLTASSVTDVLATSVADPFMVPVDGTWHMFFEVVRWQPQGKKGEIGHATSRDALRWKYHGVVLAEPFHLSYPYVFASGSDLYMIPETSRAGEVRLYRADPFPSRWIHVKTLLTGRAFTDNSIFQRDGRWWMLTDASPTHGHDTLRLFLASELLGSWSEHPRSPLVVGDPRRARPAGRVTVADDRLLRFAQVCEPQYGTSVRTFEVLELSPSTYREEEVIDAPKLAGSGRGWNLSGMHHIDLHPRDGAGWLACVDGWSANDALRQISRQLLRRRQGSRS